MRSMDRIQALIESGLDIAIQKGLVQLKHDKCIRLPDGSYLHDASCEETTK